MSDTPNYNEQTQEGTSWIRCNKVDIFNPYGGSPYLYLYEEKLYNLGAERITQACSSLVVTFDATNTKHSQLYDLLNSIYIEEREKRDNPVPPADPPPVQE